MPAGLNIIPGKAQLVGTYSEASKTGAPHDDTPETMSLVFVTAHPFAADAGRAAPVANQTLQWKFEFYSMAPAFAQSVLAVGGKAEAAYALVRDAASRKDAKLEAIHLRAVKESLTLAINECHEYYYPTEFDPPELPQKLWIADSKLLDDLRAGRQEGTGVEPPAEGGTNNGGFGLITATSPTTFEMANLGTVIEAEFTADEKGSTASVHVTLKRLIEQQRYAGLDQPVFETQSITAQLPVRIGAPQLIGTLSKPLNTGIKSCNKEERVWLAFVTISDGW